MTASIALGLSDFKQLREENYYYVDKSQFIAEVVYDKTQVLLLPRPRRFGKTLNLSMLRYFFESTSENTTQLFNGLAIAEDAEAMQHQGQYPVIYLTFKDCKETTAEDAFFRMGGLFANLYLENKTNLFDLLNEEEKQFYKKITSREADAKTLQEALAFLMRLLHQRSGKRVVVLLDEYDTPIHAAYEYDYYNEMVVFIRGLLGVALKDNKYLEKSVVTGILRIAKESIFSGLNNLMVYSLLSTRFQDYFGFTEAEVETLIADFSIKNAEDIRIWYNGYRFGEKVIYNPWSVLSFITSGDPWPIPYWINTSDNALLRGLLTHAEPQFQAQIENLLAGGTVTTTLNENAVLRDITANAVNIWSLLVFSGYLKPIARTLQESEWVYELTIPNLEVRAFYRNTLQDWVRQRTGSRLDLLLQALVNANWKDFSKLLRDTVLAVLSYHDTAGDEPERVYHAFILGLLTHLSDHYQIRSNRESGYGRYDVLMIPRDVKVPGFVFEFKKVDRPEDKDAEAAMHSALQQIRERDYALELREQGVATIWGIGVVVEGKTVWTESILLS